MNFTETQICGEPIREVSMMESLHEIEKKLTETSLCLTAIIENMIGTPRPEEKTEDREARCMKEQISMIDVLSGNVMGMAHRINDLMF